MSPGSTVQRIDVLRPLLGSVVQRTKWGGVVDGDLRGSGYFRVAERNGVFWLVDPDGGRFISKGVNTVRFDQERIGQTDRFPYAEACQAKYGSLQIWRTAAADRLASWAFNTVGCWSDELVASAGSRLLATTPVAELGASFRLHRRDQVFPDVFDPEFAAHIRASADQRCRHRRNDPGLLGTFIDNELYWSPDWRSSDELLTLFLNLPPRRPGRVAALTGLQARYRDFAQFNAVWRTPARSWQELDRIEHVAAPFVRLRPGVLNDALETKANLADPAREAFSADCDAFVAIVADRYFELCVSAIKAADPNHLVLGSRFGYQPPAGVIAAAGRHLDVISFNCYDFDPGPVIDAYAAGAKPCLITEFSFRGDDAGLPNTKGGGPRVATQTERAQAFEGYVVTALSKPNVVGYHWFEHADEPAEGRFDGEDSNFGTVTIEDHVYVELTKTMTRVNAEAERIHAAAVPAVI
ncbi:agarase [Bradyrhizobium nitroreducens]|uniref:Agarase n=1 Tax=Bradyrhizobium nitroreducens TaxID=709803 RepID=A0A2M6UBZ1_9BRAD|nr:agarase [Bradyrhizobium nitroreducens]PIT02048.1 agarase [Bradyrhizobium nitroreducens]